MYNIYRTMFSMVVKVANYTNITSDIPALLLEVSHSFSEMFLYSES